MKFSNGPVGVIGPAGDNNEYLMDLGTDFIGGNHCFSLPFRTVLTADALLHRDGQFPHPIL